MLYKKCHLDLGYTYLADRLNPNGEAIQSALDHIYISSDLKEKTLGYKLPVSSTDHVPILIELLGKNHLNRTELGGAPTMLE